MNEQDNKNAKKLGEVLNSVLLHIKENGKPTMCDFEVAFILLVAENKESALIEKIQPEDMKCVPIDEVHKDATSMGFEELLKESQVARIIESRYYMEGGCYFTPSLILMLAHLTDGNPGMGIMLSAMCYVNKIDTLHKFLDLVNCQPQLDLKDFAVYWDAQKCDRSINGSDNLVDNAKYLEYLHENN